MPHFKKLWFSLGSTVVFFQGTARNLMAKLRRFLGQLRISGFTNINELKKVKPHRIISRSSDASNPVVDPAPAVNSVEESLKNLRVSQPPEHFHSLEINTTPQNPDVVTLLWSVEGRKDSKVCFVSDRTFGAKPQFKGEDHTRDAVIFFMGPFDKPNNTFDSITINVLTGDDREVEKVGYEKCIRMLEFISERLSLLEHQIHVKHFIMTFDNFHQVTAILKHLKPKVLKKMTLKATPPLFDYPSVPSEIDQLMDLDQFKLAKHLVASNFSVPLERSAHFGDLQCTAPAIDKAQFDSIIQVNDFPFFPATLTSFRTS